MTRAGGLVFACCIALAACRSEETPEPAGRKEATAPAPTEQAAPGHAIRRQIHPSLPEFAFSLVGQADASGDTLAVQRIEIREAGQASPFQVIGEVEAQAPLRANAAPLEVLDMNFDGYADLRLVQFRAAGPNVPYLNWLFDPASRRFVASPALDAIPSARYDADKREIQSEWRDGANRYGTHVYVYVADQPVLVRKEERTYQAPGVYTLTRSRLIDGAWKTVEVREVRERL